MIEAVPGDKPQRARLVRAENPGALTLEGTNTWILAEPGASRVRHRRSRARTTPRTSIEVLSARWSSGSLTAALILVTHGHEDHAGAIDACLTRHARRFGPWIAGGAAALCRWSHDEQHQCRRVELQVSQHRVTRQIRLSLLCPIDGALITGDTVLGSGSVVGCLARWAARSLSGVPAGASPAGRCGSGALPATGTRSAGSERAACDRHVAGTSRAATRPGTRCPRRWRDARSRDVVDRVYGLPGPALHEAVVNQVKAQLEYLAARGESRAAAAMATVTQRVSRASLQAFNVEQDDRARLEPQPTSLGEVGQRLVDGLARGTHQLRQLFLREVVRNQP